MGPSIASRVPSNCKPDELTVITFGDSTTAARDGVVTYTDLLQLHFTERKLCARFLNAGIPGNTTEHAAMRFGEDVLAHAPHLVILQFGINDAAVDVWRMPPAKKPRVSLARYQQNLRHFIHHLKHAYASIIVMTPNPLCWTEYMTGRYGRFPYDPTTEDGFNVVLKDYAAAVRRLADEEEIDLVDVYTAFKHYGRRPGQSTGDLLSDGMHPNSRGHALVASILLNKLAERGHIFS